MSADSTNEDVSSIVAIYGAPVPPSSDTSETSAPTATGGPDSETQGTAVSSEAMTTNPDGPTWTPVPPYGSPTPIITGTEEGMSSAPAASSTGAAAPEVDGGGPGSGTAGSDGTGHNDADAGAPDAAVSSEPTPDEDAGPAIVPLYGAAPLN